MVLAGLISLSAVAQAGTLANGAWSPAGCGPRPEAPVVNAKDDKAYNQTVDAVNAYLPLVRTYLDCLAQEANADIKALTQSATAAQQAALAAREKVVTEVKAAGEKLK
jgi:hypothetical protein